MGKMVIVLLILLATAMTATAEAGRVIADPGAFLYDRPFGRELERLPWGTEVDILDQERFFSRVAVDGRTGWLGNVQLMTESWYRQHRATLAEPGLKLRVAVARELPCYGWSDNALLRLISPVFVLPVLAEEARRFRIRLQDQEAWVLAADVERWEPLPDRQRVYLAAAREKKEKVVFRAGSSGKPLRDFFLGLLDWARRDATDETLLRRLERTDTDLTLADLRDLASALGLRSRILEAPARFDRLESAMQRGELLLIKLRLDREEGYYLIRSLDRNAVRLLDIFRLRGRQLAFAEFLRLHVRRPRILVFSRE